MSFEIGDIVEPATVITFSGEQFDLTGTSGTVVDRQINGATVEGDSTFLYKVELFDPLVVGSGIDTQSEDMFWFSETELGGDDGTGGGLDFNGVNSLVGSGINAVSISKANIEETLSNVETTSPYHSDINRLLSIVSEDAETLTSQSQDITSESKGDLTAASGISQTLGFSSSIYNELSDNIYGFYTVVSEIEAQLQEETAQAMAVEKAAMEDDEQNFNMFYETFVDNEESVNLLMPTETNATEENNTAIPELIDSSDLSADMLNAPSLDLETD